ncbi:hypothetical protein GCM10010222_03480 [Streptomyces tanashiensis]|uniref:hypothetical protein n=1 Tax=Streptomyces tanashiensis TaxID=67367 RepID=UPI00167B8F35|nr:hypothetical protein [Streptomyces tanashiensis]GGS66356.1 hypothetical protein GCM10010222_03480 [Streptomyces tanashiensis]
MSTIVKKTLRRTAGAAAAGLLALAATLTGTGTAQAAYDPGTQTLWGDEPLYPGWHVSTSYTRLIMQADGNLVLYRTSTPGDWSRATAPWASHTVGCGTKAVMQSDGRLVVRGADGRECASLGWNKGGYAYACLQVTGEQGLHIWYTNTRCGTFTGVTARSLPATTQAELLSDLY